MTARLTIVVDTREQRPLPIDPAITCVYETLGEGDYAAKGFEAYARLERKSSSDLWGTLHGGHDRFNRELARLGDIPRAAIVVDDARDPEHAALGMNASDKEARRFIMIVRALQWTGRVPIIWAGNRDRAASYVVWALTSVVEDFDPARLAIADATTRLAGPYASRAEGRYRALAAEFGLCVVCARRPPVRPKAPGPRVCVCGRLEVGARKDIGRAA